MTLSNAERGGGASEGRSLFLLVPTKGWWWPTENGVKFGQMQRAELVGSVCIHQTSHSWKSSPCLGWMLSICCWNAGTEESKKQNSHRAIECLRLEGTSGSVKSNLAANRAVLCGLIWASPGLQIAQPLCAPVSLLADKVKNCFQSLLWLPGVAISVIVASPPTSGSSLRRSQLCFLSSLPLGHRWQQQASLLASFLNWLSPAFLASPCRSCGPTSSVLVTVTGHSSYTCAVTAWSAAAAFTTRVHSCLAFQGLPSRDVSILLYRLSILLAPRHYCCTLIIHLKFLVAFPD